MTTPNPFHGSWRITSMELWDQDAMDMEVPAFIEFTADGMGRFQFIPCLSGCRLHYRRCRCDRSVFTRREGKSTAPIPVAWH